MTDFLSSHEALKTRINEKVNGFTTLESVSEINLTGDIEADLFPMCLVGDAGTKANKSSPTTSRGHHEQLYSIIIAIENTSTAINTANQFLIDIYNALTYEDVTINKIQRWQPSNFVLPLEFMGQAQTQYHDNFTTRELVFKITLPLT
jgi:hypothetical protein